MRKKPNGVVNPEESFMIDMPIRTGQSTSAEEHHFRIKIWETGNEANFLEQDLKIKNQNANQMSDPETQVPITTGTSEPPKKKVPTNKTNGYFYNYNGTHEGHVTGQTNGNAEDVYACDGKGTGKDTFVNAKKLKITHSDFQRVCNIVKHEGLSSEKEEYLYIAHTNYNEAKRIGRTMFQLLDSDYSSVESEYKVKMKISENDKISLSSRAGAIDALLRDVDNEKKDPTDNATQWDGEDFLAWGIDTDLKPDSKTKYGHNKFDEYDYVKITKTLYNTFVAKVTGKRGGTLAYNSVHEITCKKGTHTHKLINGKNKAIYKLPNVDFAKKEYWETSEFYYKNHNKRPFGLEATRVAGYTIFWKKVKK